jgi:hypothetical protein
VNRASFAAAVDELRLDEHAYRLFSEADEAYSLTAESDGWHVFYAERGIRTNEVTYPSEDLALEDLFARLAKDPLTRRRS